MGTEGVGEEIKNGRGQRYEGEWVRNNRAVQNRGEETTGCE